MIKLFAAPLCALILVMGLSSCDNTDDNLAGEITSPDLTVQQIGESMVSVDESSGNSGTLAHSSFLEAACNGVSFGACGATASSTVVKDFGGCTIAGGLASVSGTVTLTYTGTGSGTCTIPANGDSVSRVPAFTATIVSGAKFEASALTPSGQLLTRVGSGTFTLNNTGVRRVYSTSGGTAVADVTTMTTSDITISGTTRANRVVNGGALQVTNNLTSQVCTGTPNNVAWTSTTCNCPTSGTVTGTCSTGEAFTVAFTSTCGRVDTSFGTASKTITIERCN